MQSLIFDLGPYLSYLPEFVEGDEEVTVDSELIALLASKLEEESDEIRKCRINLNLVKVKRMLGLLKGTDVETIKELE